MGQTLEMCGKPRETHSRIVTSIKKKKKTNGKDTSKKSSSERSSLSVESLKEHHANKSKIVPDNLHVKLYVDLFDSYDVDGNGTLDLEEAKLIFGDFVDGVGFWWSKMFPMLIQNHIFKQTSETDDEVDDDQIEAYMNDEMETCKEDIEKMKEHLRGPGAKVFMAHVDKDHNGAIEKNEWKAFVIEALEVLTPRVIRDGKSPHDHLKLQMNQLRRLASDQLCFESEFAPALRSMSRKLE